MRRFCAHSISVARSPAGPELERRRQRVGDVAEDERLRGQDPPDRAGREVAQLRERGGVERPRLHAVGAEGREPRRISPAALSVKVTARISPGREGAGRDLVRDPAGDRRRLAGPGAGEDADRPADELGGAPLLGVQAGEDGGGSTRPCYEGGPPSACDAICADSVSGARHRRLRAAAPSPSRRAGRRARACRRPRRGARARRAPRRASPRRSAAASGAGSSGAPSGRRPRRPTTAPRAASRPAGRR